MSTAAASSTVFAFFSEVKGNLNDEVRYTAQVHSHYHRYTIVPTQRVGDCTLLLSSAASLLQAFAFYFRMHPGIYKYSPAPISGGSRDLVPYNRRTGLRHSGLSCVSVGNHTLTLVFLTQAELMQRVSHAIDSPVIPTLYQLCTLQAINFSCDQ